jgi:YVTN family beta-propeller protein
MQIKRSPERKRSILWRVSVSVFFAIVFNSKREFRVRTSLFGLLIVGLFLSGCQAMVPQVRPGLEQEGEVYLYLQPFPQEAERLSFTVESIAAIGSDGREFPLTVSLSELRSRDVKRQRLLAAGVLPPGEYSGFSFRTKDALLKGEERESALLVPGTPTKVDFKFNVARRRGYVISLVLRYADSVGAGFSFSPAFSVFFPDKPPLGLIGFVTNKGSNDITLINKKTLQAFDVIVTGRGPSGMAVDQRSRKAYVALSGEDSVDVIDVMAGNISDRIRLNPGDEPRELALTPDGRTLLSANTGSNTVSFIGTASRVEEMRISVGNGPVSILIEPTGRRAFIFNNSSNTISVIDIQARSVITTIATDPGPVRGQFSRRGDRLFVIQELSQFVLVINPILLSTVGRFSVRPGVISIKVDPNTDLVYLGRQRDFMVGLYDPMGFGVVGFVNTGASIAYMAIDPEENNLFMVSSDKGTVSISNLTSRRIIGEIDVGERPYWATVMGER